VAKAAVVGPTTWGTTLAVHLASCGATVHLLARTEAEATALANDRRNARFLPDVPFPKGLSMTHEPSPALDGAEMVVVAVPSSSFRWNVRRLRDHLRSPTIVLSATKGLELETGLRMSQVLEQELPPALHQRICALSGPNLALEIAAGKLATTVVASRSHEAAERAQELLMSPLFRVYTSEDVVGVELGGALKNIIAIGAGLADGLGYGDNGKAAFITRGLTEITRLGVAAGASPLTFAGLAGLGDLVATCASPLSRNHRVGVQLAKGVPLEKVLASMQNVAEGVYTTGAALKMAAALGVEMPIARATQKVLFEGLEPRQAVADLMGRPPRREWEGIR